MTNDQPVRNRVRERRTARGMTQAQLADHAGISRTAVTAIEGARLVPSVAAALALAQALHTTVEDLFGRRDVTSQPVVWAWPPRTSVAADWQAEVGGRIVRYPAAALPMLSPLPDHHADSSPAAAKYAAEDTLVIACCDPAAGLLASQFAAATGLRLLVLPRSSSQAVEMLRDGLVHLAGLHLSTADDPQRNLQSALDSLGPGYQLVRIAHWQEGIVTAPSTRLRSVRAATTSKLRWVGREPGSGARMCLDRLLGNRTTPRHVARNHRGVVEAVQSGWADAGVCVQLVSAEAGLDFLPVQEEAYDVCFPTAYAADRRIQAFLSVVRSLPYRRLLGDLPGYNTAETGTLFPVS